MLCPICKIGLEYQSSKNFGGIEIQYYICSKCNISYERHVIFDAIGLVRYDRLFKITDKGYLYEI